MYCLAEGGSGILNANFWWSGQITLFILFVASAVFVLSQEHEIALGNNRQWAPNRRIVICGIVFGLHLVCGLLDYSIYLIDPAHRWW